MFYNQFNYTSLLILIKCESSNVLQKVDRVNLINLYNVKENSNLCVKNCDLLENNISKYTKYSTERMAYLYTWYLIFLKISLKHILSNQNIFSC